MNYQRQLELSELVARKLQGCVDTQQYLQFLRTQSRLYKYPFWQQAFIFSQNPNVTAVTTFDQWNKILNRRIRPGTRGIAIPDPKKQNEFIHVFDIVDTYATAQSRPVLVWEFEERYQGAVSEFLSNAYDGVTMELPFSQQLYNAAKSAVEQHLQGETEQIFSTYLPMLGEDADLSLDLIQLSVFYELLNRCGITPEECYDFSVLEAQLYEMVGEASPQAAAELIYALGTMTSTAASEVLRGIEYVVKQEMQKEITYERTDLSPRQHRRHSRPASQPDLGRQTGDGADPLESLGAGTPEVPDGNEPVRTVPDSGNAVFTSGGNQPESRRNGGTAESQPDEPGERAGQTEPTVGVDEVHGEPSEPSRRSDSIGADSGVSRPSRKSKPVEGQIALAMEETPVDVPPEVFDEVLRLGSNQENSLLRIVARYQLRDPEFIRWNREER